MEQTPAYLRFFNLFFGLRNAIDFPLRQAVRFRRSGLRLRNESKTGLFAGLLPELRVRAREEAGRLVEQYHLQGLAEESSQDNFCENLFYLELLERALQAVPAQFSETVRAADIGPSHWFYVQALYALLKWWEHPRGREVSLNGYEVDAYRVYADLRSRYDHALAHMRGLANVSYLPEPFRPEPFRPEQVEPQSPMFDLITLLFPFVFLKDHLEWGLPYELFQPLPLLAVAWQSLRAGGLLVIANQGEVEHQAQQAMLDSLGIQPAAAFRHDSLFYRYEIPRWVLVCCRGD